MVKVNQSDPPSRRNSSAKGFNDFKQNCDTKSVAIMVERFVQSIANVNDSGSFDTSFEVKTIQPKQYIRHRCVTELDRESLMKFVKAFEERNAAKRCSPLKCRNADEQVEIAQLMASTPIKKTSQIPVPRKESVVSTDSDIGSSDGHDEELLRTPKMTYVNLNDNLRLPKSRGSSGKSASKVLQFFSSAKKKVQNLRTPSRSNSATASPVMMRSHLGCKPLHHTHDTDADEEDLDDGISSNGSRNVSPDSSFEMQPPLVPTFKITPPPTAKSHQRNPAYELARIIRGSFHAKRASVAKLRRSLSDPDRHQIDVDAAANKCREGVEDENKFVAAKKVEPPRRRVGDATIKNLDVFRSRALPSDASPFRRWAQSSFRAPKAVDSQVSLPRRPSSLTASDNDVYTKSMDSYVGEFKAAAAAAVRCQLADIKNIVNGGSNSGVGGGGGCGGVHQEPTAPAGVTAWGSSFEKLLDDPAGLHTFAEFLKKEFSAENIYFWTACERYRHIDSASERAAQAMELFSKHLANGAPEPVNVDSQARTTAEENLRTAEKDLFSQAQKQIFNLMKFDSYQRFIRSDLYKKCIEAEENNQTLPYTAEGLDELLKTNFHQTAQTKLKKSASNAEDRRRKSLLPWHRKTRCKSRDRDESDNTASKSSTRNGKNQLSGNSLKISNTTNSTSDIHSSRSSLSSFDTLPQCTLNNTSDDVKACCLCRVILSDGATTIVQTRTGETVRQLVERLLEKRGISYQFFDVILNTTNKSVDLNASSQILSGKELLIEQRVAFKLDLPDPKVISVKSKPKKALCEVIKPILQKYNYCMENVQVLMRDTHEPVDLSQPVTIADGQRLQVVMLKVEHNEYPPNPAKLKAMPKSVSFPAIKPYRNGSIPNAVVNPQQSTLDEITNKVFNELLQGKVESHEVNHKAADMCSLKSEDCASETSSIFDRIRRRDSNIPGLKGLRPKKINKPSISQSDDTLSNSTQVTGGSDPSSTAAAPVKKPIIAKWKAGVKVQVTERAEYQDEFLEGLKRAQCARLEDQRGTEINFELPDFLKNKENLSAANKLRKIRANLSPVNKSAPVPLDGQQNDRQHPQPAPRLSISKKQSISPMKIDEEETTPVSSADPSTDGDSSSSKGPPPLPPKPKVLPIKPSNWGQCNSGNVKSPIIATAAPTSAIPLPSKIPIDISRKHLGSEQTGRSAYLDEPSSSFV